MTQLTPVQQQAFDTLAAAWPIDDVFLFSAADGMGRTTVLREVHRQRGGAYLDLREFLDALRPHPNRPVYFDVADGAHR